VHELLLAFLIWLTSAKAWATVIRGQEAPKEVPTIEAKASADERANRHTGYVLGPARGRTPSSSAYLAAWAPWFTVESP
jgi:hypothetical protein